MPHEGIVVDEELRKQQQKDLEIAKGCLYDKSAECPVCQREFKTKATRPSKVKYVSSEIDLKPNYTPVQPAYYDVIICDKCGFSAVSSKFNDITNSQAQRINKIITPKFKKRVYADVYDAHTAIDRYKMALICAKVMEATEGEKAFICMKIAWIYRDLGDKEREENYLKATLEGFQMAYGGDKFPMCGFDEPTLTYMLAALSYRFGNNSDAMRYLGKIITARDTSERLKQRALDLKLILKSD